MKSYTQRYTRYVVMLCLAMLVGLLAGCSGDNNSTGFIISPSQATSRIYVMNSANGSLTALAGDTTGTKFQLTLSNTKNEVNWFSDRPIREAGTDTVANYVTTTWPMYGTVAPNVVLEAFYGTRQYIQIFCTLGTPVFNSASGQFSASITVNYVEGNTGALSSLTLNDLQLVVLNNVASSVSAQWSQIMYGDSLTFQAGTDATTYTLRVTKPFPNVYGYTSAPFREFRKTQIKAYIAAWQGLYGSNPPNVAVISTAPDGTFRLQIVTLSAPAYDEATGNVTFVAKPLYGTIKAGEVLSDVELFIDAAGNPFSADLPNPVTDPADKYFQVFIKGPETGANEVHFFVNANEMNLTDPHIINPTWLTGGPKQEQTGTVYTDWENPMFQILDRKTGISATGAEFDTTYDIPLNKLPLDTASGYRILKIPYLKPGDATKSLGGSGRITFRMGDKVWSKIVKDGDGNYSIAGPSLDPPGAGGLDRFDFFELNCATPQSMGKPVCFVNSSNVDMFSFGITYKGLKSTDATGIPSLYFGVDPTNPSAVKNIIDELTAIKVIDYASALVKNADKFVRFLGPNFNLNKENGDTYKDRAIKATALDNAIEKGYETYKSVDLKFKVDSTEYVARTQSISGVDTLVFTKPDNIDLKIPKPKSWEVFTARGVLADTNYGDALRKNANKFVVAYLNRGVFHDVSKWYNIDNWCKDTVNVPCNEYARILHTYFLNNAAYAISFDDVLATTDGSPKKLSEPACGDCRAMSLLLTPPD